MKRLNKLLALILSAQLLSAFFCFAILPQTSLAAGTFFAIPKNPNAINENRFTFQVQPGKSVSDILYIGNDSNTDQTLKIYAVDGEEYQAQQGVANWIQINSSTKTLKSNEGESIPFKINVPKNQNLGTYTAGIAVENSGNSDGNVNINARIIVLIDLKVTDAPQEIAKKYPQKSFWQKINLTHFTVAGILFLLSIIGLIFAYQKEKSLKRAKPSRDD